MVGMPANPEPVLADDAIQGLDYVVADAKIDVELDEGAAVETGIDRESRAALRCLIQFQAGFTHDEDEEVIELYRCRNLKAFPQGGS